MADPLAAIEPARVQFIQKLLGELSGGASQNEVIRWAHQRLFVEGACISTLRAELSRWEKRARMIAITSGKGGVGKTTVSVNLAVAFAATGARVLLFDADLGLGNVHVFAGVNAQITLLDVIEGRKRLEELVVIGPRGVHVVCGASGVGRMADLKAGTREFLGNELLRLAAGYDVVLIDTGAGISPAVTHFLGIADDTIVVSTPNVAATLDAYGLIKVAHESALETRLHLLVNLADDERQARAVYERIAGCAVRFLQRQVNDAGFVLRDGAIEHANQCRRPLLLAEPDHRNLQCLTRIAAAFGVPHSGVSPPADFAAA